MDNTYRERIVAVLRQFPQVSRAVLFGSRAKGTARPGADIDLALEGPDLDHATLARIEHAIDEQLLPVKVDLIHRGPHTKPELEEHIRRNGIEWYSERVDPQGGRSSR